MSFETPVEALQHKLRCILVRNARIAAREEETRDDWEEAAKELEAVEAEMASYEKALKLLGFDVHAPTLEQILEDM